MRIKNTWMIAALALATGADPVSAQHAGDIGLSIDAGRIVTGTLDESGVFATGERVFAAEFGELVPNFASEPGFDNLPGTFAPGSAISFTIERAVRAWSGAGFGTIPAERIQVGFSTLAPALSPMTDVPVAGFGLLVAENGEWHRHYEFTLTEPATDGVYLLELSLSSNQPGLAASVPFWIVFNQNRPETEHDAAIEWAESNLAGGGACSLADITEVGGTAEAPALPDGQLTLDDILVFIDAYNDAVGCPGAAPCNLADLTGAGGPPEPADGQLTLDDILAFINAYNDGC